MLNHYLSCAAGQARVFQCLQENIAKSGFEDPCKAEIQKREERIQDDYRLDYGIASQCEADVEQVCSLEKVWCHNDLCCTSYVMDRLVMVEEPA